MEEKIISARVDSSILEPVYSWYFFQEDQVSLEKSILGYKITMDVKEPSDYDKLSCFVLDLIEEDYVKGLIEKSILGSGLNPSSYLLEGMVQSIFDKLAYSMDYIAKRAGLQDELKLYLYSNNYLNFQGFIDFRLRDFKEFISRFVDFEIKELEAKIEYEVFLKRLKEFLSIGEAKYDIINLYINNEGYLIKDENNKTIEDNRGLGNPKGVFPIESKSDTLISSLVIISPKRIIIHKEKFLDFELIKVLEDIFGDRIRECGGCSTCRENFDE